MIGEQSHIYKVSQLHKNQVLTALLATRHPIKLLSSDNVLIRMLTPAEASLCYLTTGCDVLGNTRRVKALRERETHGEAKWQHCYRTTEAAVLPPSPDYWARVA